MMKRLIRLATATAVVVILAAPPPDAIAQSAYTNPALKLAPKPSQSGSAKIRTATQRLPQPTPLPVSAVSSAPENSFAQASTQASTQAPNQAPDQRLAQAAVTAPASTLPGGASSLQETYQDWQVTCVQQAPTKRCVLSQQQIDPQSKQRVVVIEIGAIAADKIEGSLVLPFGLALDRGAVLQIDDGPIGQPLRFRTCLATGCIVAVSLDAATVAAMRKGTSLKIKLVSDAGQELPLTLPLKGFSEALARTTALAK